MIDSVLDRSYLLIHQRQKRLHYACLPLLLLLFSLIISRIISRIMTITIIIIIVVVMEIIISSQRLFDHTYYLS